MSLYKARKGNIEFYIQPEMIEPYSIAGYEIIKLEEVVVHDISAEVSAVSAEMEVMNGQ